MTRSQMLRETILSARDFRKAAVSVPEWGLETGLYVRSLSIRDAVAFEQSNKDLDPTHTSSLYLAYTLCDEDGERVFDPSVDVPDLLTRDPDILSRLFDQALHLNNGDPKKPDEEGKSLPNPLLEELSS